MIDALHCVTQGCRFSLAQVKPPPLTTQVNEYNWRFPFSLDLSFNRIAERGATILCTALRANKLITKLDLRGNNLHDRGAGALCAALKFNQVLEVKNVGSI